MFRFQFPFRTHQQMILDAFERERKATDVGVLRFHVVAPPGSGKTIVGLEMAIRLGKPALIICPNTAIQGQWVNKLEMFLPKGETTNQWASGDASVQKFLNVLTYQVLSIPEDPGEAMLGVAEGLWVEDLLTSNGITESEARERLEAMKQSNATVYKKELAKYTKRLRTGKLSETSGSSTDFVGLLHPNTRALLQRLKNSGVKTVVFDECHHLQSWWAQIMKHILDWMDIDAVIGLTATPPLDEKPDVLENYKGLLGEIDFQIPTPAVVKDGMLAPYQDLAYFCMPAPDEMAYLTKCHEKLHALLMQFCAVECDFKTWMIYRFLDRRLVDGTQREWSKLLKTRPDYAVAGVKYLRKAGIPLPPDMMIPIGAQPDLTLDDWIPLVEDYALNRLKISGDTADAAMYQLVRDALYRLGFVLTEKGVRSYISPLDRVLAYSKSKLIAVKDILLTEHQAMGKNLRAAVVTDFEFSNAMSLSQTEGILDKECGGAVSVMKMMVSDPAMDLLNPVMVTGKSLLCDDDIADGFMMRLGQWAEKNQLDIRLEKVPLYDGRLFEIVGSGSGWSTRSAILFTTSELEAGNTQCIIGTRGLLGEGWDCISLNVLIDLCVAATYASVNQLRGRSIRKSEATPRKLSNNWDVATVAPTLEKGLNDYLRMKRKHEHFYGITADGHIQKGMNHLDMKLAFDDSLSAEELNEVNRHMLEKATERDIRYDEWKIGEPFQNVEQACFEFEMDYNIVLRDSGNPSQEKEKLKQKVNSAMIQGGLGTAGLVAAAVAGLTALPLGLGLGALSALFLYGSARSFTKAGDISRSAVLSEDAHRFAEKMAFCILESLQLAGLMANETKQPKLSLTKREDGSFRVYLDASPEASELFASSLNDVLSPVVDQRYVIQRLEGHMPGIGLFAAIREGLHPSRTVVADYHPVPAVLGQNKEKALLFEQCWNKYISRGQVVFLRSKEGEAILSQYGMTSKLGIRRHKAAIWR